MTEEESWTSGGSGSDSGSDSGSSSDGDECVEADGFKASPNHGHLKGKGEHNSVQELQTVLAQKDQLLATFQSQVDQLQKSKDAAVRLLQATLRTETSFDDLGDLSGQDVLETMDALVSGAESMNVGKLRQKAAEFAKTVMERKASLAVAVLAACDEHYGALKEYELEHLALSKIRSKPDMIIEQGQCAMLSAKCIKYIAMDDDMDADEYMMFQILDHWNKEGSDKLTPTERKAITSYLTKHIALDLIDPTLLYSHVRNSGLVSDAQLVEAFGKQASILATYNNTFPKRNARKAVTESCVWKSSETKVIQTDEAMSFTDTITGCVMKSGVNKFSLHVDEQAPDELFLGIARASNEQRNSRYLGAQGIGGGGWSFCSNGYKYSEKSQPSNTRHGLVLTEGSTVNFTLSLSTITKLNRLDAAVDGGDPVVLFRGKDLEDDGSGFVPPATLVGTATIRFLGFEN